MDYVVMPKSDYQDACDAIREKTGETGLIVSGDMGSKIRSIPQSESGFQYIQLEYIETDGTQCIDTGFCPNNNTIVDIIFWAEQMSSMAIIGASDDDVSSFCAYTNVVEYGSSAEDVALYSDEQSNILFDKCSVYHNGSEVYTFEEEEFQCPFSLFLFACNRSGEMQDFTTGKLYSCQIYDGDILVRDFMPCFNVASGEIGMYDFVENTFYGNAGDGYFGGHIPCYELAPI